MAKECLFCIAKRIFIESNKNVTTQSKISDRFEMIHEIKTTQEGLARKGSLKITLKFGSKKDANNFRVVQGEGLSNTPSQHTEVDAIEADLCGRKVTQKGVTS